MRILRNILAGAVLLAFAASAAVAQLAQPVQQSPVRLDVATGMQANSAAVNTAVTLTIPAISGQYVYVTGIYIDVCSNGTGTAQNNVSWTSTNLGGWTSQYSFAATASICQHWSDIYPTGYKAPISGTAVTIVSPTAAANNGYAARATYYYASQ